jgi:glycosyltransferase involved in cell wall biosynthesis
MQKIDSWPNDESAGLQLQASPLSPGLKLIIQIPCFNEEGTLAQTLAELPRSVEGFEVVEWLVIDDGSSDRTVEVAKAGGANYIISLPYNMGLARAFMAGVEAAVVHGADVIVNTDADNQYCAECIVDLVKPILRGEAQIVVGARPIAEIQEFSYIKKQLQRLGSYVVRLASGTDIADAPSGFRAIQREAALQLNVFGDYTYTLETIIQAGRKSIPITSVPIKVNPSTRPSRLVKSIPKYVYRSILSIARIFVLYKPLRFFFTIAILLFVPGFLVGVRFLYQYMIGEGAGHIQSLILASILIVTAVIVAANRVLLEDVRMRLIRFGHARGAGRPVD